MFSQKEITDKERESNQIRINPGWLKACGAGMMLLGPWGFFMYPIYALFITIFGIVIYLAACDGSTPME